MIISYQIWYNMYSYYLKHTVLCVSLTVAENTCIFRVTTILYTPTTMGALINGCFISSTVHIIQPYSPCSLTICCLSGDIHCSTKVQHSTHNIAIFNTPQIVTDSPPCVIVIDLNTSSPITYDITSQPDWPILTCCGEEKFTVIKC